MTAERIDLTNRLVDLDRRLIVESRVTAIVLGLTLATAGNAIAVAYDKQSSPNETMTGKLITDSKRNTNSTVATKPTDLNLNSGKTKKIVSRPRPAPNLVSAGKTLKQPLKSTPQVKGQAPSLANPLSQTMRLPQSAIRKRTTGFSPNEIRPMSEITKDNLDRAELSSDHYKEFLNKIDTSHLAFAQQYTSFNPNKVKISQDRTKFFTLHFTASYTNFGESSNAQPVGKMDVRKLIEYMGTRGEVCCGVNWILDRDGQVFQTAPFAAKLRHNPPFDNINTGVEVESSDQDSVTPGQYEALSYLTIAVLKREGILNQALEQTVHGHGEDRDKVRQNDPNTKWETRNDFDGEVSRYFRSKVGLFLNQNPELAEIAVPFK